MWVGRDDGFRGGVLGVAEGAVFELDALREGKGWRGGEGAEEEERGWFE